MEMMISLPSSRGLSYAIYFDIPPHQLLYLTILCTEDAKKKKSKKRKKKRCGQTGEDVVAGAYSNTEY